MHVNHTFLFAEGEWTARGLYWNEKHQSAAVEGSTKVWHLQDKWLIKGTLRVLANDIQEFTTEYEVEPFAPGTDSTNWIAHNRMLGKFIGSFIIIEDSIVSLYRSRDCPCFGSEYLPKLSDDTYKVLGTLFCDDKRISSWSVRLTRNAR